MDPLRPVLMSLVARTMQSPPIPEAQYCECRCANHGYRNGGMHCAPCCEPNFKDPEESRRRRIAIEKWHADREFLAYLESDPPDFREQLEAYKVKMEAESNLYVPKLSEYEQDVANGYKPSIQDRLRVYKRMKADARG